MMIKASFAAISLFWAVAGYAQWYRDPNCKYCDIQPAMGDWYQCTQASSNHDSRATGPYKDCKTTARQVDRQGYSTNECTGSEKCGPDPESSIIGKTQYFAVNLQKSCHGALLKGHLRVSATIRSEKA